MKKCTALTMGFMSSIFAMEEEKINPLTVLNQENVARIFRQVCERTEEETTS
ncbi:MAG: hypothetical protein K2X98_00340 [Alphaproteobacteria bacterium]|nr:hypothetical protein [Alphaproteobacteria bacterium]